MMELLNLLLNVIPIALVAAISPTTFAVLVVLLSLSKRPKISGTGFLAGSVIIVMLAALFGILTGGSVFYFTKSDPEPLKAWIDLLLGILILGYGVKIIINKKELWVTGELDEQKDKSPRHEFVSSLLLAMGLFALNFITTILVFFAGTEIAISTAGFFGKTISLIILIITTLLLVEIPIIICFLRPQKAEIILLKLNEWIKKNGYYLTAILVFVIGGYFLYNGLTALNVI